MRRIGWTLLALAACAAVAAAGPAMTPLELPEGKPGIGFDDLVYAPELERLIVPAGRSGYLDLVEPQGHRVTAIGGFSKDARYGGGHGSGTTSAVFSPHGLLAIDRSRQSLHLVDPARGKVMATAPLGGGPDYVRWVPGVEEAWVTEPDREAIEVFTLGGSPARLSLQRTIAVPGGPESLVVDPSRGRAYTHLWKGGTVAVDLRTHALVAHWDNRCRGSRGIALDGERGWLFVGCAEGKAVVLDVGHDGRVLDEKPAGNGVDIIAYNPRLRHLYLPGARSADLSVLGVTPAGRLTLLATVPAAGDAHCVTVDGRDTVYVCDPNQGRLLLWQDALPPAE